MLSLQLQILSHSLAPVLPISTDSNHTSISHGAASNETLCFLET